MVTVFRDIKPEFVDARGGITRVLSDSKAVVKSVLLITSKKGSIRANHYHKRDSHYSYMLSGRMEPHSAKSAPVDRLVSLFRNATPEEQNFIIQTAKFIIRNKKRTK